MTGSGADGSRPVAIPVPAVPDKMALPDPMAIADHDQLSAEEHRYIGAARAANTVRGYHSDWTEFATWSRQHDVDPLPAAPRTISGYLTLLAGHGAKVGTMSRRLSAIKFVHKLQNPASHPPQSMTSSRPPSLQRVSTTPPATPRTASAPDSSPTPTPAAPPTTPSPARPATGP